MTGAGTIIDIMRASALLKELDGKYVTNSESVDPHTRSVDPHTGQAAENAEIIEKSHTDAQISNRRDVENVSTSVSTPTAFQTTNGAISITIQIQVNCSADEVVGLGSKIRSLIDEVSKPANTDLPLDDQFIEIDLNQVGDPVNEKLDLAKVEEQVGQAGLQLKLTDKSESEDK